MKRNVGDTRSKMVFENVWRRTSIKVVDLKNSRAAKTFEKSGKKAAVKTLK